MKGIKIFRSEGWYVAEIPSLHVVTRGRTLRKLKANLKEAIALAVESMVDVKKLGENKLTVKAYT